MTLADSGGETWLPLWTLRQNIYTDPQKPLQMDPGLYAIGEPNDRSPLLVTSNFSLTYFIVSTEAEATGTACHLAVVDAEGLRFLDDDTHAAVVEQIVADRQGNPGGAR